MRVLLSHPFCFPLCFHFMRSSHCFASSHSSDALPSIHFSLNDPTRPLLGYAYVAVGETGKRWGPARLFLTKLNTFSKARFTLLSIDSLWARSFVLLKSRPSYATGKIFYSLYTHAVLRSLLNDGRERGVAADGHPPLVLIFIHASDCI